MEPLMPQWLSFRDSIREIVSKELTFNYNSLFRIHYSGSPHLSIFHERDQKEARRQAHQVRSNIIEALSLWKFIDQHVEWRSADQGQSGWISRKNQLSELMQYNTDNDLIRAVVMLESLPTPILRRTLWGNNIDFSSSESLLRRLNREQKDGITAAYRDFWDKEVMPAVCGSCWGMRVMKESRLDVLLTGFDSHARHQKTHSMSSDFLGMGFGFNAYPKGATDDTKVIEVSPMRFLSVKNHAEDFVVNREYGIYASLFTAVRCDYVFHPKRVVEIKEAFCPGFWYTMIVAAIFLVISPLYAVGFTGALAAGWMSGWMSGFVVLAALPGSLTLSWLLLAGIKYFALAALSRMTTLNKFLERHDTFIKNMSMALVLSASGLLMFLLIGLLYQVLGKAYLTLISLSLVYAILWLVRGITRVLIKKGEIFEPESWLVWLRYATHSVSLVLFVNVIWQFHRQIGRAVIGAAIAVYTWFVSVFAGMMEFFQVLGWVSLAFATPLVFAAVVLFLIKKGDEIGVDEGQPSPRWLVLLSKAASLLATMSIILCVGAYIYFWLFLAWSDITPIAFSVIFTATVLLLLESVIIWGFKPETREASAISKRINSEFRFNLDEKVSAESILRSRWLFYLPKPERIDRVNKIIRFVSRVFVNHEDEDQSDILRACFWRMDERAFGQIIAAESKLSDLNREKRRATLLKMLFGHDFEEALRLVQADIAAEFAVKEARRQRWEKRKELIKKFFFPIIFVWDLIVTVVSAIVNAIDKVVRSLRAFHRLHEFLKKRCPFTAPVEEVQI